MSIYSNLFGGEDDEEAKTKPQKKAKDRPNRMITE